MVQTCFIYLESLKEGTQADKHFQCFANIHGLVFQQSLKKTLHMCYIYHIHATETRQKLYEK